MTIDHAKLRAGIGVARFDNCVLVLDIGADRYLSMSRSMAMPLLWVAGIEAGPVDPTRLERLTALGLIERSACVQRRPQSVAPTKNMVTGRTRPTRFGAFQFLEVAAHLVRSIVEIKVCRLDRVLAGLNGRRRQPSSKIEELASDFQRYRRLLPVHSVCLPDSIALMRFLMRHGHRPHLVFGVDAHPFAAHCWVQGDDTVLNDEIDHVRRFAPIFAV